MRGAGIGWGVLRVAGRRLRLGLRPPRHPRHWFEALGVALLFAAIAFPVALADGLLPRPLRGESLAVLAPLALRVLVAPALIEEVLFRLLPNPHPAEAPERGTRALWVLLSLAAYLAAHPLAAIVSPGRAEVFLDAQFLFLTTLLGACCLVLYIRSGSIWPALLLHWAVVFGWLALGGRGLLPV